MIPKVNTSIKAIEEGVRASVIIDGRVDHACLLELFTSHGVGTLFKKTYNKNNNGSNWTLSRRGSLL